MARFTSLFITGTDTGVGKTTVACALAAAFRQRGLRVGVCKPAETGCADGADGRLLPADARQLAYFAECRLALDVICPYALRDPLAPALAARRDGTAIDIERLTAAYEIVAQAHDITLVEGAGGLLVPLTARETFADVALRLGIPLVVVVGSRLGAINHALLTIRYARSLGLETLGYVMNTLGAQPDLAAETNAAVLTEWIGPPLGCVPFLGTVECCDADRTRLAACAEDHLRVAALLRPA